MVQENENKPVEAVVQKEKDPKKIGTIILLVAVSLLLVVWIINMKTVRVVPVKNESHEQALASFLSAVELNDKNKMYSLMLYAHMEGMDKEQVERFSVDNRLYYLNQKAAQETDGSRSAKRFVERQAGRQMKAIRAETEAYFGEGQSIIYKVYFMYDGDPDSVKPMYLELVPGLDDKWYVKVIDNDAFIEALGLLLDADGHPRLPLDSASYGKTLLEEMGDEDWKQLYLTAYATQQSPRNSLKMGFNSPLGISWSELVYSYFALAAGYEEGEAFDSVEQYEIREKELNDFLMDTYDTAIDLKEMRLMDLTMLSKEHRADIALEYGTNKVILTPPAPLDRGLALSAMDITGKELLENGAVRVWMEYHQPDAMPETQQEGWEQAPDAMEDAAEQDEAQVMIHELTVYQDAEKLHLVSYYIYPKEAGEPEQLIIHYLTANLFRASVMKVEDTYHLGWSNPEAGSDLALKISKLRFEEALSEAEIDFDAWEKRLSVSLECRDRGFLEIQVWEDQQGAFFAILYTYRKAQVPNTRTGLPVKGVLYSEEYVGIAYTIYQLEQESGRQFVADMEEIYALGKK